MAKEIRATNLSSWAKSVKKRPDIKGIGERRSTSYHLFLSSSQISLCCDLHGYLGLNSAVLVGIVVILDILHMYFKSVRSLWLRTDQH